MKQIMPDPWASVAERYPVGARVHGKVVSLADYGAFVELEPGIEGLVHVSEMSWTKRVTHPSKVLEVGQEVDVMVLDVDTANRRISLALKGALARAAPPPEEEEEEEDYTPPPPRPQNPNLKGGLGNRP